MTQQQAYDFGFDAGKNGANTTNCNFSIFARAELTRAWERGNKAGLAANRDSYSTKRAVE